MLCMPFTMGCTTIVMPLKAGAVTSAEGSNHGYVMRRVHLQWNGKDQTGEKFPFVVKWRLADDAGVTKANGVSKEI